jgi:N12 class adenine-specific DNA methylase
VQAGDGERTVLNPDATLAAQEKAAEMGERFSEWVWEDPARAAALARIYNDRFNSLVLRNYDDTYSSMPGLALTFRPRPHQVAAVARMVHEPAVLLAHEVGAGKTAEMIIGVTELRRLGLARKPAVIVPNHMLEQFAREWLQLYPHARVLVARREDLQGERRRRFIARCATGDWDGVVMSRSAFERIPLSPGEQQAYMDRELELMHTWLENAKSGDGDGLTVKRLQGALLRAGERLKAKLDSAKDPGITFEATGIDYLCVDEAHGYKNLRTASNIADAAIDGSMRASDLDMKTGYLRRRNGARVVTFATATPIANSVTEAYVMQRYLRPDLLLTDQSRPSASSLEMSGFIGADHALREARPGSQFCLRDARIAAPAARCRDPSELNVGAHGHDAPLWQAEEIYRALRCA